MQLTPCPVVGRWDADEGGWREDLAPLPDRVEFDLLPTAWCELPADQQEQQREQS
jgi:hypothetical protein